MKDKYLPIGTVVKLKGGEKNLMITSYLIFSIVQKTKEKKIFDYGACPFPEGIIESTHGIGFNHNEIEKIVHLGLINDEQKKFNDLINKSAEDIKKYYEELAQSE